MGFYISDPALAADIEAIGKLTGESPEQVLLAAVRERLARLALDGAA